MAYKNYHNDYDNLNNWLSHVPNYEPRETDDARQVETKLRNQRVRVNLTYLICFTIVDINNMDQGPQKPKSNFENSSIRLCNMNVLIVAL